MNRRLFITAMGSATASTAGLTLLNNANGASATTDFFAKGLIIVSFEDPQVLRLGFPKAHGHKATLAIVPHTGQQRTLNLKGTYTLETTVSRRGKPDYKVPELIQMQEIYGEKIRSRVQDCPVVINIPYAAIQSITAVETSPTRYTFVRADNGQEIRTFRPRKVAETLRFKISSDATIKLDGGKTSIVLNQIKEFHAEHNPEDPAGIAGNAAFAAHFPYYDAYLDRPANATFDVIPKNLGQSQVAPPKVGTNFMPLWPYVICFLIGI